MNSRRTNPNSSGSDSLECGPRAFVSEVAGVERGPGFHEDDVDLIAQGGGTVFRPFRDEDEFTFIHDDIPVSQLHQQPAFHHQKQLILVVVMMPGKLAFDSNQFDLRIIDVTHDFRVPVVTEALELFFQANLVNRHGAFQTELLVLSGKVFGNRTKSMRG